MLSNRNHWNKSRIVTFVLCVLGILTASIPHPIAKTSTRAETEAKVEAGVNPGYQGTTTDERTQIKVTAGPASVRVNTWNGNLFYPTPLLTIPGRGLPIELSLGYNSGQRGSNSPYGYGWQFSHNVAYEREDNGDVTILRGDGRRDRFTYEGSTLVPPPGVHDALTQYEPDKYLLRTKEGIRFYFDNPIHKRLTRLEDPNGNALSLTYDANMLLTVLTDASGRQITFSYAGGRLTTITDPNATPARSFQLAYDGSGNLTSITDPLNQATNYQYDAGHFLTLIMDSRGVTTSVTYANGAVGNVASALTSQSFTYITPTLTTIVTNTVSAGDRVTRYVYDADRTISRVERVEDGSGGVVSTQFAWDEGKNLVRFTDENNRATDYAYDSTGNLLVITDTMGFTTTYTYEGVYNQVTSVTDANGHITLFQYDGHANLTAETDPLDDVTSYAYDAWGNVISATNALSQTTTYAYDFHGNLTVITDSLGHATSFTYDGVGNLLSAADANGHTTIYGYDSLNRLITATNPLSETTISDYDTAGNLAHITDPENNALAYAYDGLDRLVRVTNALGGETGYTYDAAGNLTRITDAAGRTTTFVYDRLNRLVTEADPLGYTTVYTYDSAGNLTARTDANGATTTYTYDNLDRLTAIDYPGADYDVTYTYDPVGNRMMASNPNVTVHYTYDGLDRVVTANNVLPTFSKAITYTYDAVDNRATMTDPDGGITTYEYDAASRLITLTNPLAQETVYTYDDGGRLIRRNQDNGTYATYEYDEAGRVLTLTNRTSTAAIISSYAYEYDRAGNRTQMTEAGGGVTTYGYDDLYRLTHVTYPDSNSQDYAYDAVGNRLTLTDTTGATGYAYDDADRLASAGTVTYTWDNNGNMIGKTTVTGTTYYAYDYENRLVAITYTNGLTNTFTYYPDGMRFSLTDTGGNITQYFLDGPNVVIETDDSSVTSARYTSAGTDNWIGIEWGGTTYYYHQDGLGSVVGLTDASQTVATAYQYDVFGLIKNQTGSSANPYFYAGRRWDDDSNFYYSRSRLYDPACGRFITKDSWRGENPRPATLHRYIYVSNNPINLIDPFGHAYFGKRPLGGWIPPLTRYSPFKPLYDIVNIELEHEHIFFDTPQWIYMNDHWKRVSNVGFNKDGKLFEDDSPGYVRSSGHYDDARIADTINDMVRNDNLGSYSLVGDPRHLFQDKNNCQDVCDRVRQEYNRQGTNGIPNGGGPPGGGGDPGGDYGGGGGGDGVIESRPLLNISPSVFLDEPEPALAIDRAPQSLGLVSLSDVLPTTGLANTTGTIYTPTLAFAITDVVSAQAIDFIHDETALTKGVVVGIETQNTVYEHDHSVCSRFHGYTAEAVAPVLVPGPSSEQAWFWYASEHKDDLLEEVFTFAVFVDESTKRFTVDSRWRWDDYQSEPLPDHDYVFNFQIWAPSAADAYDLVRQTLVNLAAFDSGSWSLDFVNTVQPTTPSVIIQKGAQVGSDVHLTLRSWFTETVGISLEGSWRSYTDRTSSISFTQSVSVTPGVDDVILSFPQLLDAVIYTDDGHFGDKVYVGSGFWFAFDDKGEPWPQSQVTRIDLDCTEPTGLDASALTVPSCAGITGTITHTSGYVGLGVTINPNGMPIDVSEHAALTFQARGDGRSYHLKLETDSVQYGDFHETVLTAPTEWRQFVIPLAAFRQRRENTLVPFTGTDVKALVWVAEGPLPDPSVHLEIDQVAFFDSVVISDTTGLTSTNDVFGPYPITAHIVGIESATLRYSPDGGHTFTPVTMTLAGGNVYTGQIPGQPMGTDISYYLEAADGDGNVATDPPDAPFMTHHFRVEWYPSLLVDDFFDAGSTNLLGGDSGITQQGGAATASYQDGALCLTYDITGTGGYVVYYSLLRELDVTAYRSLSFRVKGAVGGEKAKIGLRDGHDHEPKLEIGEHLPNGVTTTWQTVRAPLTAFTRVITDWSQMHSFSLAFEEGIGSGQGKLCIDDVRFEPHALPILLDNFNDLDDQNGVGQLHDVDVGGGASLVVGYDQANPYGGVGASLTLTYTVPGDAYAAWHSGLGDLDVSSYDKLSFAVRGASGGEDFHVWLVDQEGHSGWVNVISYTTVANTWPSTPVEIPLQEFAAEGVDLTQLNLFKVAFEWVPMNGTVYLDNIRFTLPPSPTITALSPVTTTNDVSTALTLTGTHFLMTPTVALGYNLLENVTLPSSTTLTATIPPGIAAGVHDAWIIQPNMQFGMMNDAFTMYNVYGLMLTPDTDAKSGNPRATVTYTLQVTNTGSTTDAYTVTISNNAWTTTVPETVGPLVAGDSVNASVAVTISENAAGGATDTTTILMTSQGDNTQLATSTLTTTANNVYSLTLTPATDTKSGDPGATVSYTLQVTNTGNATDVYTITVSDNDWGTTVPGMVGPLVASDSAKITVMVTISASVADGVTDTVTITVISQGDNTRSLASTLTTIASLYRVFLPITMRDFEFELFQSHSP